MMIDTDIRPVTVEIDGAEYEVAPKTVAVAKKLAEAEKRMVGKNMLYELWLAEMKVLLGEAAVRELFPNGDQENLDRMEAIYQGVMDAFNGNARARQDAQLQQAADALRQLNRLYDRVGKAPGGDRKLIPRQA